MTSDEIGLNIDRIAAAMKPFNEAAENAAKKIAYTERRLDEIGVGVTLLHGPQVGDRVISYRRTSCGRFRIVVQHEGSITHAVETDRETRIMVASKLAELVAMIADKSEAMLVERHLDA